MMEWWKSIGTAWNLSEGGELPLAGLEKSMKSETGPYSLDWGVPLKYS